MKLQKLKGTKDYSGKEKLVRSRIESTLKKTFELYGFSPFETSTISLLQTLTSKYSGGDEIIKEIYKLKDQGKRELGLRYDLTVPLAKFIGLNPQLKMPFKRYEIGKVFRDGPIKTGRLREFSQCDIDIIGSKSMRVEAELLQIAQDVFQKLGIKVTIRINNRKVLNGLIKSAGITKNSDQAILVLDKIEKVGEQEVVKELKEKGFSQKQITRLLEFVKLEGTNKNIVKELKSIIKDEEGKKGIEELEELLQFLNMLKVKVKLDVSLARGLSYYTGTIYEVFTKGFSSSLAAGGRWDNMIAEFLGSKREYPAVGLSFGVEPIAQVMKDVPNSVSQVYIVPIGTQKECNEIAQELRKEGINTDIDLLKKSIGKNLQYANSKKIPFVILVGEEEVKKSKVKLKDMNSGEESLLSLKNAIKKIKN